MNVKNNDNIVEDQNFSTQFVYHFECVNLSGFTDESSKLTEPVF
jgi:hypothetical protein